VSNRQGAAARQVLHEEVKVHQARQAEVEAKVGEALAAEGLIDSLISGLQAAEGELSFLIHSAKLGLEEIRGPPRPRPAPFAPPLLTRRAARLSAHAPRQGAHRSTARTLLTTRATAATPPQPVRRRARRGPPPARAAAERVGGGGAGIRWFTAAGLPMHHPEDRDKSFGLPYPAGHMMREEGGMWSFASTRRLAPPTPQPTAKDALRAQEDAAAAEALRAQEEEKKTAGAAAAAAAQQEAAAAAAAAARPQPGEPGAKRARLEPAGAAGAAAGAGSGGGAAAGGREASLGAGEVELKWEEEGDGSGSSQARPRPRPRALARASERKYSRVSGREKSRRRGGGDTPSVMREVGKCRTRWLSGRGGARRAERGGERGRLRHASRQKRAAHGRGHVGRRRRGRRRGPRPERGQGRGFRLRLVRRG